MILPGKLVSRVFHKAERTRTRARRVEWRRLQGGGDVRPHAQRRPSTSTRRSVPTSASDKALTIWLQRPSCRVYKRAMPRRQRRQYQYQYQYHQQQRLQYSVPFAGTSDDAIQRPRGANPEAAIRRCVGDRLPISKSPPAAFAPPCASPLESCDAV